MHMARMAPVLTSITMAVTARALLTAMHSRMARSVKAWMLLSTVSCTVCPVWGAI